MALALGFALAPPATVHAQGGPLVLIDPDPALARAAEVALEPWGLSVRTRTAASPGPSLPRSTEKARALAEQDGAAALAWMSESPEGYALWVYERQGDRVVAQPVAGPPPYDDADAAALALTLKALLRHSLAAPAEERFGVGTPPPSRRAGVVLGIAGGVRAFELEGGSVEPRLWLSVAYLFEALGGRVGPVLEANLGFGGVDANGALARTNLRAHALALGAAGRFPLGERLDLGALAALTLRRSVLEGQLDAPVQPIDVTRSNPTVAARLSGGVHVGRVRLSIRAGVDVPLRTQRYVADGQKVLELSQAAFEAGLGTEIYLQ